MMNKKIVIGIIVILALLILGFVFTSKGKAPSNSDLNNQNQSASTSQGGDNNQFSLKGLLGAGSNKQCSFADAESAGVVFVSNGKMRGDFTYQSGTTTMASHMITDSKTSHMWVDGQKQGFKTDLEKMQNFQGEKNKALQGVDVDKNYNFDCKDWRVDSSVFTLPTDIEFTDMGKMMESMMPKATTPGASGGSTAPSGSMDITSICNQLPEPSKSECLASMKK